MKEPLLYRLTRPFIKIFMLIFFRPTYLGLDNIPLAENIVLSGNHTNNLDCLLLISSTKHIIHFLAKDSLCKGPQKIIFSNMGIIPVNRQIHDKEALANAISALNNNQTIGIFPEGTINRTQDLILPFKIGCIKMAHDTKTPIVPFIITGHYQLFKKNITIEFLPPITNISDNLTEENKRLMNLISSKLKEKRK